jgi:hypothetical protein
MSPRSSLTSTRWSPRVDEELSGVPGLGLDPRDVDPRVVRGRLAPRDRTEVAGCRRDAAGRGRGADRAAAADARGTEHRRDGVAARLHPGRRDGRHRGPGWQGRGLGLEDAPTSWWWGERRLEVRQGGLAQASDPRRSRVRGAPRATVPRRPRGWRVRSRRRGAKNSAEPVLWSSWPAESSPTSISTPTSRPGHSPGSASGGRCACPPRVRRSGHACGCRLAFLVAASALFGIGYWVFTKLNGS